jgi:hypothetical protein
LVNMTSNQGRKFVYVNEGISEVRVPYSTEERYDTHAATPYLLICVNSPTDMKTKNINVSEEDVLLGNIIDVAF